MNSKRLIYTLTAGELKRGDTFLWPDGSETVVTDIRATSGTKCVNVVFNYGGSEVLDRMRKTTSVRIACDSNRKKDAVLYSQTIHPFIIADILEIPRHSRHESVSRQTVAQFRNMLTLAETLGILAGRTPDCTDERYQISLSQATTLRRQYAHQRGDLRTSLATLKERERTKALCERLNALVYLGTLTGVPGKYDWLPRSPWTPFANAHSMPLSHWLTIHSDAKGYAIGQPYSPWPTGQPTCFTVHIPNYPNESGGTALAAVNVVNDLYSTKTAPDYSDLACALVEARHLAANGTLELLVARELDPAAADCILVDCGAKYPVSVPATQLLAMLSPSSKNAVLNPQAA